MRMIGYILILLFIFVFYILEVGYPKHKWFKNILHDKYNMHIPDFENQLDYDIHTKTAYTSCKYCHKPMIYVGVCMYLVHNNPKEIPNIAYDSYCMQCISKNHTNICGHCPLTCDRDTCNDCTMKGDIL